MIQVPSVYLENKFIIFLILNNIYINILEYMIFFIVLMATFTCSIQITILIAKYVECLVLGIDSILDCDTYLTFIT